MLLQPFLGLPLAHTMMLVYIYLCMLFTASIGSVSSTYVIYSNVTYLLFSTFLFIFLLYMLYVASQDSL